MKKLIFFILLLSIPTSASAEKLTPQILATHFNLRTILSSFGPGMKTYCGSYPVDFFHKDNTRFEKDAVIFETQEDYFVITIIGENKIRVTDQIKPPATYYSTATYDVIFDKEHGDIRANETYTEVPNPCEPYPLQR